LCDEIQRRKLDFKWDVRAHVNTVSPDLLRAMKDAGCDRIHYGVEAGNDRILKVIQKQTKVERVREAVQWTKNVDMEVLVYFMIGHPTETASDIQDTIRLAKELVPNYVHFTIFCPYPATASYMEGLQNGVIKQDVWREFAASPTENYELPFWEENFTSDELREYLVQAYKSFYLRPGYVIKNLARIRTWGEFKRKAKAGLSVVTMNAGQRAIAIRKKVRDIVPLANYDTTE
jgi:radical SAM superfamily enzyme YgiQ (UPF0313 family)